VRGGSGVKGWQEHVTHRTLAGFTGTIVGGRGPLSVLAKWLS
jgi:hypothetical protein